MTSRQTLFQTAVAAAERYEAQRSNGSVGPDAASIAALAAFGEVSLDEPIGGAAALELLDRIGSPATMRSTGGRYFGFVNGGVTDEARAAAVLAGTWDQNAALPVMSPTSGALDAAAASLIVDVLNLPAQSTASFCAGATVANITGIITGRDELLRRQGWDVHERGLWGAPPINVVTSAEAHISVHKALRVAGFGQEQVTEVSTDACGRLDPAQLRPQSGATLVLLQAGNVNTGHSDPFDHVADLVSGPDTWMHVDGAFGLWANAAPERQHHVAGVERADSWATDGHKWLNVPYDCGVIVCADGDALARSMRMSAAYAAASGEERSPMGLGLQMSQAARSIPVWTVLAARGRGGVADAIKHGCRCAERFATALVEAGAEVLAPVVLNQALVAFGDDTTTNAVVDAVQAAGVCWMGATTWNSRRAMRISVSDLSTTFDDVDRSVEAIVGAWRSLAPSPGPSLGPSLGAG